MPHCERIRTLAALPILLTILAAGCREPRGQAGRDGGAPVSISFMVFGDPGELRAYRNLTQAFEKEQPGIRVELIHLPSQSDYRRRLGTDFVAGTPADVILINYRRYPAFAARGVLEPLEPYLARSTRIREGDFFPQALAPFRWQGRLYGIPQNASSLVVYYNRELFDAAGLPYPRDDWTWQEFLKTARALTRDTDGDGDTDQYGLGVEPTLVRLAPFIWQNGGELVDDPAAPRALLLHRDEAVDAIEWFVALQRTHRVVPGAVEEQAEDSESRFLNGRTAMLLNSRRGVPTYRESAAFAWDVAPLPRHRRRAGILHADAYCMPASARNKEAIWKLIEFANSPEGQRIVARSGRTVPSLRAVAESPAFLEPEEPPARSRVFLDELPFARAMPVHPGWVDVEEYADDELRRAFYGQASVAEAIVGAIQRTREYLERR